MLDLSIFRNRLFSTASGAAFVNGLSRFALMFLFVFYFQGVQGDSPILAGVKLAPLALGMLVSSPLAGMWADRRGSRTLAVLGMLVTASALALMTTLQRDTSYMWPGALHVHRRDRLGHVQLAQHRRDDGHGAAAPTRHRRRRAGAACRTPARSSRSRSCWLSSPRPSPSRCCSRCSPAWPTTSPTPSSMPFISNMHTALWCLCAVSLVGAAISAARPKDVDRAGRRGGPRAPGGHVMSATADRAAADRRGGRAHRDHPAHDPLLRGDRAAGRRARSGSRASTASTPRPTSSRVREIIRLRDLLGLSLEQLSQLLEAESARAAAARELAPDRGPDRAPRDPRGGARRTSAPSWSWFATRLRRARPSSAAELSDKQRKAEQKLARSTRDEHRRRVRAEAPPGRGAQPGSTGARWRCCRSGTCSPTSARARSRRCCRS